MADHATLVEIAAALGVSRQAASKRAAKEAWPCQEDARGGKPTKVYHLATLPKAVAHAVFMYSQGAQHAESDGNRSSGSETGSGHAATSRNDGARGAVAAPGGGTQPGKRGGVGGQAVVPAAQGGRFDAERLSDRQQTILEARARIKQFVDAYPGSVKGALIHLNLDHDADRLPGPLKWAYDHCHDKPRAGTRLAPKTYYNWLADLRERGTLAPARKESDTRVKPWHADAFALRQRPQGSTLTWVHEELVKLGHAVSYDQVARFFREQASQLDQLKGRYTGSQLRALTFYQHRSSAGMQPWDEVHADGWNTHFTAPHPVTSEYVTYEVWHAHDVATRYVPPFSVGLTENFEVIAKCIENTIRAGGTMRILQTDSTRIVKHSERMKTNPATALADRAGFTIVHPQTVGNSQANGIAENFNTWLDKEARELATYQHPKQMDTLSFKRGRKLTAAMAKAANAGDLATLHAKQHELERLNKGLVLTSHEMACAWLEEKRQKWNHKPHRALPKVRDPDTGRLRHQTPFEALMQHIDAGWDASLPPDLSDAELERHFIRTFRPHVQVKVTRGTVTPYGGMRYRHAALDEWLGKPVVVAYDVTDWRRVWVTTLNGDPICVADFVAATGYRTLSAIEAAEEKRAAARIRAKERAIELERARLPGDVIEHPPLLAQVIDINPVPAKAAVPEKSWAATMAELAEAEKPAEDEKPMTYLESVAMYFGAHQDEEADEAENPPEEVAAR